MRNFMRLLLLCIVLTLALLFMVSCTSNSASESISSTTSEESVSSEVEATPVPTKEPETQNSDTSQQSETSDEHEEPVVVKTGLITDGSYSVSATVNLYSNNTLELLNFNYNGRAPDVYIAIGNKSDGGNFEKIKLVTDILEGSFDNQVIAIQLEDGDDFNAVSVYCDAYSEDFGSTVLNDIK